MPSQRRSGGFLHRPHRHRATPAVSKPMIFRPMASRPCGSAMLRAMPPDSATSPPSARARPAGAALWIAALDRGAPLPLSRQLAAALRAAIAEGQLGAGARLPSTRALAAELGLARSTVVAVFEQLAAEGYIAAQRGSGYFVPANLTEVRAVPPREATL